MSARKAGVPAPDDWRAETLARIRALIVEAVPGIVEERKWKKPSNRMQGIPVWSHHGIVCTGETYQRYVKLTFAHGAELPDPAGLFKASLAGGTRRAIDLHEGARLNARAFKTLVRAAAARNAAAGAKGKPVRLLSGGNPQIAKGDGEAPVRAFIAAMPGWTRRVGRQLDGLISGAVPGAQKAVKWNSPFYGVAGRGWFLSYHVFARYVKVAFFRGTSLKPNPPVGSKSPETRYLHIHEADVLDEAQFVKWVKQAATLPGWVP